MTQPSLYYPIKPAEVAQPFGVNEGANYSVLLGVKGHPGVDLVNYKNNVNLSFGMPVHSACKGIISAVEHDTNGGWTVVMVSDQQFNFGTGTTQLKIIYAHCMAGSIVVKEGNKVDIGTTLARCGSSGVIPGALTEDPARAHVHFGAKPCNLNPGNPPDEPPYWQNTYQDNGFGGAIDPLPYWNGLYAEDYAEPEMFVKPQPEKLVANTQLTELNNLSNQVSLLTQVVQFLKQLVNKLFP